MLDRRFFERTDTKHNKASLLESYKAVYTRSTMVLFSRKTRTPLAALTIKADDVGCLSMLTGRPSPKDSSDPHFQGMLNMPNQAFTFTISNLSDKGLINFNVLHTPHRVSTVDPGPSYGINEVNELRVNESYTIEADQRNNRKMILRGKTKTVVDPETLREKEVALTVDETETKTKGEGLYFYLSVVPDASCKALVEKYSEGTIWKVAPGFVRVLTRPPPPMPRRQLFYGSLPVEVPEWRSSARGSGNEIASQMPEPALVGYPSHCGVAMAQAHSQSQRSFGFAGPSLQIPHPSVAAARRSHVQSASQGHSLPSNPSSSSSSSRSADVFMCSASDVSLRQRYFGGRGGSRGRGGGRGGGAPAMARKKMSAAFTQKKRSASEGLGLLSGMKEKAAGRRSKPSTSVQDRGREGGGDAATDSISADNSWDQPNQPSSFVAEAEADVGGTQAGELEYGGRVEVRSRSTGHDYAYHRASEPTVLCMSIWEGMKFLPIESGAIEAQLAAEMEEWMTNEGKALINSLNAVFKNDTCAIDMESEADTIVCTCGHQCLNHANVVGSLRKCPLCRSPITAFVRADGIVVE